MSTTLLQYAVPIAIVCATASVSALVAAMIGKAGERRSVRVSVNGKIVRLEGVDSSDVEAALTSLNSKRNTASDRRRVPAETA